MSDETAIATVLPSAAVQTRDWHAWNDFMPPAPDYLHVTGEVQVPNPGVDPILVVKEPQGINPSILLLDLYLRQSPGIWPQIVCWKPVSFQKLITDKYTEVTIFSEGTQIASIPVKDVS